MEEHLLNECCVEIKCFIRSATTNYRSYSSLYVFQPNIHVNNENDV